MLKFKWKLTLTLTPLDQPKGSENVAWKVKSESSLALINESGYTLGYQLGYQASCYLTLRVRLSRPCLSFPFWQVILSLGFGTVAQEDGRDTKVATVTSPIYDFAPVRRFSLVFTESYMLMVMLLRLSLVGRSLWETAKMVYPSRIIARKFTNPRIKYMSRTNPASRGIWQSVGASSLFTFKNLNTTLFRLLSLCRRKQVWVPAFPYR